MRRKKAKKHDMGNEVGFFLMSGDGVRTLTFNELAKGMNILDKKPSTENGVAAKPDRQPDLLSTEEDEARLAADLKAITEPKNPRYDPELDRVIRALRPDWF